MSISKTLVISMMVSSVLLSETISLSSSDRADMIQKQQSGGENPVSGKANTEDSKVERAKADNYRDAVLAEYYIENNAKRYTFTAGVKMDFLANNTVVYEQEVKDEIKKRDEAERDEAERNIKRFYTRGYCSFLNTVDISEIVSFAEIECTLDNIGKAIMSINIYPEHSAKALVARPISIIPYNTDQNKRLSVAEGVIMNGQRTGINVASIINDRKVERMFAAGLLVTNNIAATESMRYMNALEASKQRQDSEVIPGTGGSAPIVIQSNNTVSPDAADYLTVAGIKMTSSLIGIIGESMVNDLPYLYRIERGQRVYFDGLVTSEMPDARRGPIDYTNTSMIRKTENGVSVDKDGIVTFDKNEKQNLQPGNDFQIQPLSGLNSNKNNPNNRAYSQPRKTKANSNSVINPIYDAIGAKR